MHHRLIIIALSAGLCSMAHAQDQPRDVIKRAIEAHGGADKIAKLRRARVTYHLRGIVPEMEHYGQVNIEIEETYDLPRIKKVIEGMIGPRPVDVRWAILADGRSWYQENGGRVKTEAAAGNGETQIRPYQIIEQLPRLAGDDIKLEPVRNWSWVQVRHSGDRKCMV